MLDPICKREISAAMLKADIALLDEQLEHAESYGRLGRYDLVGLLKDCIKARKRALAEAEAESGQR